MKLVDIERGLKRYLPEGGGIIEKAMRYSVLSPGKRIRPLIVCESAVLCGASISAAMPAACAVEFIHTYSLIHDDLPAMDDDDMRRGKPTCHKVFGEANAILAGDALLTLAFDIMAKHLEPKKALRVIREMACAAGTNGMIGGQALDIEFGDRHRFSIKTVSVPILRKINMLKTARLFEASAKAGAIIAGADKKKTGALGRFGLYFGMAFQAVDDHIDKESAARKEAFAMTEKAKRELKLFGKKADRLRAIADYAVKREL